MRIGKKDVDAFEVNGTTLLQKIVSLDLVAFAKVILEHELADANDVCAGRETPPILDAASYGSVEMLRLLLEKPYQMEPMEPG